MGEDARTSVEVEEGKLIVQKLHNLNSDLEKNAPLTPLPDDGEPDIKDYNDELAFIGPLTWRNAPWLYTECYMYRTIRTFFSLRQAPFWQKYDVFAKQKRSSLSASKRGFVELVHWFRNVSRTTEEEALNTPEELKTLVEETIDISLWGNATDLSLLTTISIEEIQSRQGKKARQALKQNVVDDDTDQVWELLQRLLQQSDNSSREVHFVLDNCGFELFADLVLAAYLLRAGYATKIVLHGKAMGWFVSDVTAQDVEDLLQAFSADDSDLLGGVDEEAQADLKWFGTDLQTLFDKRQLQYQDHPFWTSAHPFGRLGDAAPELYEELSRAELVIFKGDLNYRKLVFDGLWPRTTTFKQAIGALGNAKNAGGLRVLALRTCKADTCVGLQPGQEEILDRETGGEWQRNGKYAVISYCDAKGGAG